MTRQILLVDDEPQVLDGLRRSLHGQYAVDTATSGPEGLSRVADAEIPYAVVVSDMMMPGMDGAEFLTLAHRASPDTVQMILSGQAELRSTIAAVNDANLFRFLTKPCETADLVRALDAALAQYRLVCAEREVLERTLDGVIEVLTELMSTASPLAFSRTRQVKALAEAVAEAVPVTLTWELRAAAMLGQVGLMAIPEEVADRIRRGEEVSAATMEMYRTHPRLAYDLIRRIPRLERVADWVGAQPVTFEDATHLRAAADPPDGEDLSGRDIYAAVTAFLTGVEGGRSPEFVASELGKTGRYSGGLLKAVLQTYVRIKVRKPRRIAGEELMVGMVVNQDVVTTTGLTLVRSGELLTESMAIRLRHFAHGIGVIEPVAVLV